MCFFLNGMRGIQHSSNQVRASAPITPAACQPRIETRSWVRVQSGPSKWHSLELRTVVAVRTHASRPNLVVLFDLVVSEILGRVGDLGG